MRIHAWLVSALVAGPPSPEKLQLPLPATVTIVPPGVTFRTRLLYESAINGSSGFSVGGRTRFLLPRRVLTAGGPLELPIAGQRDTTFPPRSPGTCVASTGNEGIFFP